MMDFKRAVHLSIVLSLLGFALIFLFYPQGRDIPSRISEINRDCTGYVDFTGTVKQTSFSSNGNLVAGVAQGRSTILVFLKDFFVEIGDNISVSGRANRFSNECWIFPDRVELK